MGPWAQGPMGPRAHGPKGPRAHGPLQLPTPPVANPSGCQPLRLPTPPVANPSGCQPLPWRFVSTGGLLLELKKKWCFVSTGGLLCLESRCFVSTAAHFWTTRKYPAELAETSPSTAAPTPPPSTRTGGQDDGSYANSLKLQQIDMLTCRVGIWFTS